MREIFKRMSQWFAADDPYDLPKNSTGLESLGLMALAAQPTPQDIAHEAERTAQARAGRLERRCNSDSLVLG